MQSEKIAIGRAPPPLLKVISTDHTDALILTKSLQQFRAKWKERLIRQAIIFQNDRLLDLLENPVKPARDAPFATQIIFRKVSKHLARPVNTIQDRAGSQT
jgi:hypothetical protein